MERLVNVREQRGRRYAEYFGDVTDPEPYAQHRRGFHQAAGRRAEAAKPVPGSALQPGRQLAGSERGMAAGYLDRALRTEAADQLAQQQRIARRSSRQGEQAAVRG